MSAVLVDYPDWVHELHEECEQLSREVERLQAFINPHGKFGELDDTDQTLLNAQVSAMKAYQYILLMRLERIGI